MTKLQIMDTTIRDGQQSLWATRMTIGDMQPILEKMDKVGYWAIEAWGGATFDTCLRFLDENPWERLRTIKASTPNTKLAMLSRGQNLVGYKHYSKDVVNRFIACAHKNGIDVFRVFDALNDIRNVKDNAEAIKAVGAQFEGAISYTVSPVHTLDGYLEYSQALKDLGADSIAIKDMAGMLTPYRAERLIKALKSEIGLPVHLHCHYVGGLAPMNIIKAAEAGADIVDTASAPLAFGNSHPAVETVVAAFQESERDTGLDLDLLFEIADYWEGVRKRGHYQRGVSSLTHMKVFSHQVPGGMMSNLVSQLAIQNSEDRLGEVMEEIPRVRAEVGYPPLVTPMSQIVGTQAVMNVITGKRWGLVSKEMKDYICGYYGKAPGKMDENIVKKVVGTSDVLPDNVAPASLATTTFDELKEEIGDLAHDEEDVLMYALFPNEARTYLSKHRTGEAVPFNMIEESSLTTEEDYVDINQIRDLIRTVKEEGVGEVIVEEAGNRVQVRMPEAVMAANASALAAAGAVVPAANAAALTPAAAAEAPAGGVAAPAPGADANRPATWVPVTAPMVGTFYAAPAPGEPPFVKVGDEVSAKQTLCIVEAMKLMNEIEAEEMCTVREVCLEDATPVEFGTVMFYVEPTKN